MRGLRDTEPYAVEMADGRTIFYDANRAYIWRGRLVFYVGLWRMVGAIERGQWVRVAEGVGPDDLRHNE